MALIHPFRALRPVPEMAAAVAAVPYDVVSREEACALAEGNPHSFLHVSRAEIDLDIQTNPYADVVYRKAAENLEVLRQSVPLVVEEEPSLYFYRLQDGSHQQTGLAGCYSIDEYERGIIKRHERTRADKEDDRTRHIVTVGAQTGIAFLTYRAPEEIAALEARACEDVPLFDITAPDGVRHMVWRLTDADQEAVVKALARVTTLYIADGHHRIASAARARSEFHDPLAEAGYFLGVAFPDTETRILPYNRTVGDLAGMTSDEFLAVIKSRFPVVSGVQPVPPKGEIRMYLAGQWHSVNLDADNSSAGSDLVATLDVMRLQNQILEPLLEVVDIRTDPRMAFVGGIKGTEELERLVDSGSAAVAFSLAAVTTDELLAVSDADAIMPPKSTWFEPKLRDGLLIHML